MIGVRVHGLCKCYRAGGELVQALDDVSFEAAPGAFVAVIGYSGCGKTTLFRHIAGLETPDSGNTIFRNGAGSEIVRPRLGMMFQEPRLLPWRTVRDNLALALKRTTIPDKDAAVREALSLVGLGGFMQAYPDQLSGGMAQRVALARAVCRKPELLLMDEPFGALDALTRLQLQVELARIWSHRPMTVLFITHDIGEAVALADRVLIMAQGRLVGERRVGLPRPRQVGSTDFEAVRKELMDTILAKNT